MIAYVFKPRRKVNGKAEVQRTYRGRYRLQGESTLHDVALDTTDKQVAQARLLALVQEKEREKAGLIAPKLERESATRPVTVHLDDFMRDLATLGRSSAYRQLVRSRIERLLDECRFTELKDITPGRFVEWRSRQNETLGPKTLNEYLNAVSNLLNWLKRQGRIAHNPLAAVAKVDVRGRQRKRRALTEPEFERLLEVAPARRLVYLTAVYTGLRLGELSQLQWADLHLEAERPYLLARESTTKNRKEAIIPLRRELAQELKAFHRPENSPGDRVFSINRHLNRFFRRDLLAAGIAPLDALGRKVDFHALRKTFGTRLAQHGTSQRLAQELMRHSDPRLTACTYTDERLLPTFEAVAALPWEGAASHPSPSHPASQAPDPPGPSVAQTVLGNEAKNRVQPLDLSTVFHALTLTGTTGLTQVAAGWGTRPTAGRTELLSTDDASWGKRRTRFPPDFG